MKRSFIIFAVLLALGGCKGTSLNGEASSHGPDHVVVGFPF